MEDQDAHHGHGAAVGLQQEMLEQVLHRTSLFGIIVLLFGIATAILNFWLLLVQHLLGRSFNIVLAVTQAKKSPLSLDHIKLELARMVSFLLLLLVAVDVLETLSKPGHHYAMEELYKMILIGSIRTTLAYFLGKETEDIMHHIKQAQNQIHSEEHEALKPEDEDETKKSTAEEESKPQVTHDTCLEKEEQKKAKKQLTEK